MQQRLMKMHEYEKYRTYRAMRSVALGVRVLLYIALVVALTLSAIFYFPGIPGAQAASAAIEATGGHLRYLGFSLLTFAACVSYFFVTGGQYCQIVAELDEVALRLGYPKDVRK